MVSKSSFYMMLAWLGLLTGSAAPALAIETLPTAEPSTSWSEQTRDSENRSLEDLSPESLPGLTDTLGANTETVEPTIDDANVAITDGIDAQDGFNLAQVSDPSPEPVEAAAQNPNDQVPEGITVANSSSPETIANPQQSQDQTDRLAQSTSSDALAQSTPVSQLRDIDPRHWAAQALRQLSQRYNCLPDYYSDDATLTRYEFADVLAGCLDVINGIVADGSADNATQDDLAVVQRLSEEFRSELDTLGDRIGQLEDQVQTLQDQQFVKRTTLFGIGEFLLTDSFSDSIYTVNNNVNTTFTTGNFILDIDTKVRGRDFVRVELSMSNIPDYGRLDTGTDMARIDALPGNNDPTGVKVQLSNLFYQTRFAGTGILRIGATGQVANHIIPDLSPVQANSRFGRRSPIYRPNAGAGFLSTYQVNDWMGLAAGYTVGGDVAETPSTGLFGGGQNRLITQATFTPNPRLGVALTYSRVYQDGDNAPPPVSITGFTGSFNAQAPFGNNTPTSANLFGIQSNYRVSRRVAIGGWVMYSRATAESNATLVPFNYLQRGLNPPPPPLRGVNDGASADIWTWALGTQIDDVGRKGNSLGFVFGMPPKAVRNTFAAFADQDTSYHAEVYYRYRVTPRIFVTPGVYAIFNPEHNDNNDTLWVGMVRTFMRF